VTKRRYENQNETKPKRKKKELKINAGKIGRFGVVMTPFA